MTDWEIVKLDIEMMATDLGFALLCILVLAWLPFALLYWRLKEGK